MKAHQREDLRTSDLAIAAAVAIVVLVMAGLAMQMAHLRRRADAPIIDPGIGIPIRVKPVLELAAMGTNAGGKGEAGLPAEWARPDPPTEIAPSVSPSTTPRRRRPPTNNKPPPPPGEQAPPGEPPAEAGATSGGEGEGEGEGGPGGDPLGSRAIAAYRERLIRWLAARFEVRDSGLSRAELAVMRVRAQIEISEGGLVLDYKILSADHPAFDAAARVALDAIKGEPVPAPPDHYPGALQRHIKITFVCTESTCD